MKNMIKILLSAVFAFMLTSCGVEDVDVQKSLDVHFIDVGQADASLVISDGEAMLIDGGNSEDSNLIYSYLTDYGVEHLEYIIASHAHEDHMGGLSGALEKTTVGKIYMPKAGSDNKFYQKFMEKSKDIEKIVPKSGESFTLGDCKVELMVPAKDFSDELNNTSIITKVTCGEKSFLFTGDAEREEEEDILAQGLDIRADVLKAGHHGSDSSSTYPFLREIMPEIVVISVGKGNEYGHPHNEALSRFSDAGAIVYRTDESGHIVIHTDGENLTVNQRKEPKASHVPTKEPTPDPTPEPTVEPTLEPTAETTMEPTLEQTSAPKTEKTDGVVAGAVAGTVSGNDANEVKETPEPTPEAVAKTEGSYIGNKNSKKLHIPSCGSLPLEKNRKYFNSAEEAYGQGYVGCKLCMQ